MLSKPTVYRTGAHTDYYENEINQFSTHSSGDIPPFLTHNCTLDYRKVCRDADYVFQVPRLLEICIDKMKIKHKRLF